MGDAAATEARILEAGTAEVAHYGIAGARVDRVAAAVAINKSQIHAYFGSKNGLFDAVFGHRGAGDRHKLDALAEEKRSVHERREAALAATAQRAFCVTDG